MFVGKLADQLAEAGHEVVVYQPIISSGFAGNSTGVKHCRVIEREPTFTLPSMPDMNMAWDPEAASLTRATSMLGHMGNTFKLSCEGREIVLH
jgi:hypothetical protein